MRVALPRLFDQQLDVFEQMLMHFPYKCDPVATQVVHPLSVSYNKLGDLEYGQGHVQAAVDQYRQGLAVRQQALQHSDQQGAAQQLDVAVSTIKVADACQVGMVDTIGTACSCAALWLLHWQAGLQHAANKICRTCYGQLLRPPHVNAGLRSAR